MMTGDVVVVADIDLHLRKKSMIPEVARAGRKSGLRQVGYRNVSEKDRVMILE